MNTSKANFLNSGLIFAGLNKVAELFCGKRKCKTNYQIVVFTIDELVSSTNISHPHIIQSA